MSAASAWPASLEGTPAIHVIERAISCGRLSHSLLLQGEDLVLLTAVAHAMADRLLNVPGSTAQFPSGQHPDCHALRPAGKMRIISADATRALISKVQVSPSVSPHKVAIVHEADRMHPTAANVFLKTLEEPPRATTLLLLTTRPHALLPTIRSRVQVFRFPAEALPFDDAAWQAWIVDYQAWTARLCDGAAGKKEAADLLFAAYGLIARFSHILELSTSAAWDAQKASMPPDLSDEEKAAVETGLSVGIRTRFFADIERATRAFAAPRLSAGENDLRRPLGATIDALERSFGLLAVNLNENAALEVFLLAALRAWTRR